MNVAGIDAHATYLVVAIVSKTGELLQKPTHITNGNAAKLLALLGLPQSGLREPKPEHGVTP